MLQIQAGKSVLSFGLVVVDVQNGFVSTGGSYDKLGMNVENYQKAVPLTKELINFCRSIGIPVFYTEAVCRGYSLFFKYKPDFLFSKIDTIVEVKLCNSKEVEKDIISQINDDIVAYRTKYSNLIFVVYDVGVIRDQDKFRKSIEANDVVVRVVKH